MCCLFLATLKSETGLLSSMPRTFYEMFARLKAQTKSLQLKVTPTLRKATGTNNDVVVDFPNLYANALASSFLMEYGCEKLPLYVADVGLVELGIGYPRSLEEAKILYEPLVQEAGRKFRRDKHPEMAVDRMKSVVNDPAAQGNHFEYVIAEYGIPLLLTKPFSVAGMDGIFAGTWVLPEPQFGCMAEPCGEDGIVLYEWLNKALDVNAWNTSLPPRGMMFPPNKAGPDICAILLKRGRRKEVAAIALMLIQAKLREDLNASDALLVVDPKLMYHENRKSLATVIGKYAMAQKKFIQQIANVPIVRVLISGAKEVREG